MICLLESIPDLRSVKTSALKLDDAQVMPFRHALLRLPHLRAWELNLGWREDEGHVQPTFRMLSQMPKLREFSINAMHRPLKAVLHSPEAQRHIVALRLDNVTVESDSGSLCNLIISLPGLQRLNLSVHGVPPDPVFDALRGISSQLVELSLSFDRFAMWFLSRKLDFKRVLLLPMPCLCSLTLDTLILNPNTLQVLQEGGYMPSLNFLSMAVFNSGAPWNDARALVESGRWENLRTIVIQTAGEVREDASTLHWADVSKACVAKGVELRHSRVDY